MIKKQIIDRDNEVIIRAHTLLSTHMQVCEHHGYTADYPVVYFDDDNMQPSWLQEFKIYLVYTGESPHEGLTYLGTVMLNNTKFVVHVYYEKL